MKRVSIFLSILVLISFLSFSLAQEDNATKTNIDLNKTKEEITNALSKIPKPEGINDYNFFENQAKIPESLSFPFRVFLGVKDSNITWGSLIIYLIIWVCLLILIFNIMEFTPFEKSWTKWLVSLGLVFILSTLGMIWDISKFIEGIFKGAFSLKYLWVILGVIAIIMILSWIKRRVKPEVEKAEAEAKGIEVGVAIKGLTKDAEAVAKSTENNS